ncbi:MAG: hypothetical protein IT373_12400, partial [Polyangiaceae bacterium]|nr:hypothetical protein [Polyangiaceae bacterium]
MRVLCAAGAIGLAACETAAGLSLAGAPWPRAVVCDDPSLAQARAPAAPAPIEQGGAASGPTCDPMAELVCGAEAPADEAPARPARAIAAEGRIL